GRRLSRRRRHHPGDAAWRGAGRLHVVRPVPQPRESVQGRQVQDHPARRGIGDGPGTRRAVDLRLCQDRRAAPADAVHLLQHRVRPALYLPARCAEGPCAVHARGHRESREGSRIAGRGGQGQARHDISAARESGEAGQPALRNATGVDRTAQEHQPEFALGHASSTMGRTNMKRATALFIGLAALLGAAVGASADDALKVAVPQRGAWDAGLTELGKRGGIFKKHGLDVEVLYTQAGPESIQALIGGSIDIAVAAGVSAAVGTFAKGAPIRIIGSEIVGAPDLYWYVRAESPVRKIEDFNDKTVAFSLTGSSSHAGLLALIAQYKLTAKPTSTGSITATLTQTLTGQVDVGFSGVPFFLDKVEAKDIRIIATGSDVTALKTRTGRVNLTNLNTLQNRKDVLRRFHIAYKETIEWMYS